MKLNLEIPPVEETLREVVVRKGWLSERFSKMPMYIMLPTELQEVVYEHVRLSIRPRLKARLWWDVHEELRRAVPRRRFWRKMQACMLREVHEELRRVVPTKV